MTTVVTGSAGHLGEAIVRTLRASGRAAIGLDLKASPFTDRVGSIGDRGFVMDCLRGARAVIHTATLHKPHVATHSAQDFIDVNVTGSLILLESAVSEGVGAFVYCSTTSAFGSALTPAPDQPAAWVTEDVAPIPKNIYGATKLAAETLCELFARSHNLPVIVLRLARFFPEADDDAGVRRVYQTANTQSNEMLFRRVDIEDAVGASLVAADRAAALAFGRFIISATTPFAASDLEELQRDAPAVVRRLFVDWDPIYAARGWTMFPHIGRVYDNGRARSALGWRPKYDFRHVLDCLAKGADFRSPLAIEVGSKGYHDTIFDEGPYPVA